MVLIHPCRPSQSDSHMIRSSQSACHVSYCNYETDDVTSQAHICINCIDDGLHKLQNQILYCPPQKEEKAEDGGGKMNCSPCRVTLSQLTRPQRYDRCYYKCICPRWVAIALKSVPRRWSGNGAYIAGHCRTKCFSSQ